MDINKVNYVNSVSQVTCLWWWNFFTAGFDTQQLLHLNPKVYIKIENCNFRSFSILLCMIAV